MQFVVNKNRVISRKDLFSAKKKFHNEEAKLPFKEKIKILVKLQEISSCVKGKDKMIWKI